MTRTELPFEAFILGYVLVMSGIATVIALVAGVAVAGL